MVVDFTRCMLIKSAHLTTTQEYKSIISINLTTAFAVCAAAGNYLTS